MEAKTIGRLRRNLEQLRARIRDSAESVAEQALGPSGGQDGGDLSNAPFHLGDEGTEEFLHDMSAALAENEVYLLREIQDAIARIDNRDYGRCESCGRAIAAERLEAMPYARHCVRCAEKNHTGLNVNLNTGRPLSPADTLAPEGAMGESWRPADDAEVTSRRRNRAAVDGHAAGEPGGGSAVGGLAGSNAGRGDPELADLQDAAGSGAFDANAGRGSSRETPRSGRSGGAVGGTPARKRST
jgi:RNA polymerase-binding transcription factor DksA